jgi:large subunit ribosomal protein L29
MAKTTHASELADTDLFEQLSEAKQELFNLRFQHVTGQLDNTARVKQVKKTVARLLTELRAREIAAAEALEGQVGKNEETIDG